MAADTPTPRSYDQILGDLITGFLSKYGLASLKVGSPVLSILEAAAQSDLRSSDDMFTFLESTSLDNAQGLALQRLGADDQVQLLAQRPASGVVTVTDTTFQKVSTRVYQGTPAPIPGTLTVNVVDASGFGASGSVYVGRGTKNVEGPLAYSAKLPPGTGPGTSGGAWWSLTLVSGTQRFHDQGEPVVYAQGGNRAIPAGAIVQTAAGGTASPVQYRVQYQATIPDGEVQVQGVQVKALKPGLAGNVGAKAITGFATTPFAGAVATNPAPITNGRPTEDPESYRERIRDARASRTKGTPLALQVAATGVTATDEDKSVQSAAYVNRLGQPGTVYVDDGTGYEERSVGVAIETLLDAAVGGERFAKLSHWPVAKAYVAATLTAPYVLAGGAEIAFSVGGVVTTHTFDVASFRAVSAADAFEVVDSVNANPALNWGLRTADGGTRVVAFAKADENEAIQLAGAVNDYAGAFGFAAGEVDTLRLYRDDQLLSKDGAPAVIVSQPQALWSTLGPTEDLELEVDGAPLSALVGGMYTFTAADFVAAGTGFVAVGKNTPVAWAAVLNYRVPGITASVVDGLITITSNRGLSAAARLRVLGGSLVAKGMFAPAEIAHGADSDYTLNRNTGEIALAVPLATGSKLAAGSVQTRAFLQSATFPSRAVTSADFWFSVDGAAVTVPTGLSGSTPVVFTTTSTAWGKRQRLAQASGTGMFSAVAVGDALVLWDPAAPAALLNRWWRVATVAADGSYVEWDALAVSDNTGTPISLTSAGVTVTRTLAQLQRVNLPALAAYTASSAAPLITAGLYGAQASVYRTQAVRVNTATYSNGDVALVAVNADAAGFGFPVGSAVPNVAGHLAAAESGNGDVGTPDFHQAEVASTPAVPSSATAFDMIWSPDASGYEAQPGLGAKLLGLRNRPDGRTVATTRWGNNRGFDTPLASVSTTGTANTFAITTQRGVPVEWVPTDRVAACRAFELAPDDDLVVLVDGDTATHRYDVPMWRTLTPVGTTYGTTNTFRDADNGGQSLAAAFGSGASGFDFADFAVYMAARAKTDSGSLTKAILWRSRRLGADGNLVRVRYVNPVSANQGVGYSVTNNVSQYTDVNVSLASGAARTGYTVQATSRVGVAMTSAASGMGTVVFALGFPISSASRTSNVTQVTVTLPAGITNHGITVGAQVYVNSTSGSFGSGVKTVTAVTSTTLSYAETAADVGATANIGDVSYDTARATLAGGNQVAGDFFFLAPTSPASVGGSAMVTSGVGAQTWTGKVPWSGATGSTLNWAPLTDVTAFRFFVNPAQAASAVVSAVDAIAAGDARLPVRATLIGDGTGVIDRSSDEAASASPTWTQLSDGLNYVRATIVPGSPAGDYQLTFKGPVTAGLATSSDWANEVVRVVPRTAANVTAWLNQLAVSGLSNAADVERVRGGHHVQLLSLTPGSGGSVEVQGGSANAAAAPVQGSASTISPAGCLVTVPAANAQGFQAGAYVAADNQVALPRAVIDEFTNLQTVTSTATESTITVDGLGTPFTSYSSSPSSSCLLTFERVGRYVAVSDTRLGGTLNSDTAAEGDLVQFSPPAAVTYPPSNPSYNACSSVAAGNVGAFRIVRVVRHPDYAGGGGTIWIENAAAVEQTLAECDVLFMTSDSAAVGDKLIVATPFWDGPGGSNQGTYTITSVGDAGSGPYTSRVVIKVTPAMHPVSVSPGVLGTQAPLVQVVEGTPTHLVKRILSVAPNPVSASLLDVKLSTTPGYQHLGAAAGTVLTVQDKLAFPTEIAAGADGYRYNTGLLQAVNKVLYGDPADPATYPGVVAANSRVNVLGSPVRRVQVTIAIRLRTGASRADVEQQVQSAVAAVINAVPTGSPVVLSELTAAASKVGGVYSAVMVAPAATATSDLIAIQPYEKPRVLDATKDVLVAFIGE